MGSLFPEPCSISNVIENHLSLLTDHPLCVYLMLFLILCIQHRNNSWANFAVFHFKHFSLFINKASEVSVLSVTKAEFTRKYAR